MTKIITPPARGKGGKFQSRKQTETKVEPEVAEEIPHVEVESEENDEQQETEVKSESHEEFIKDGVFEEPKKEDSDYVQSSKEINLDEKAESEKNTAKVNFMKGDFMKDFISKKTKPSEAETEEQKKEGESAQSKQSEEVKTEAKTEPGFAAADMADFAEVFMDILDMGISTGLRFWAKDTSTTEYELPVDKKRRLVRQLTNLFMKYQTKFSLEFMFIVTLAICYSVPISKANKRRKGIKAGVVEPNKREPGKPSKR